jgi:small conductance mechanosensitive channel
VLAVRPFAPNDFYWDVYFATNEAIRDELTKAGYPVPEQHHLVRKAS